MISSILVAPGNLNFVGEICNFEKVKITNIIFSPDLIVYQPSMMKKLEC
jgi:hypothetical protein